MTKVRDDVRAAFNNEQAGLGDVADARHRLLQNAVTARDATSHRLQWVAGIAAVLIAALVVVSFALVRAGINSHAVPTATPKAKASPTPLSRQLNVPDSTALVLYDDPANLVQIDGMTWDGMVTGKLLHQPIGAGNPANNRFAGSNYIEDRAGSTVATGNFGAKSFGGTWADDEVHFCQMVPFDYLGANGVPATLQLVTPGQPPRSVAQVGKVYEQVITRVATCSVLADRAVVVQSGGQGMGTVQYWVVQLSSGRVLWTHSFQDQQFPFVEVVASRDAMYVAEDYSSSGAQLAAAGSAIFGPDGSIMARLHGWVEGFSWDGSLVVTDGGYGSGPVSVLVWDTGNVTWSAPVGYTLSRVEAQPDGTSLAIWISPAAQAAQSAAVLLADLYVVASDGHVIARIHDTAL